jgi:hypothetical protein
VVSIPTPFQTLAAAVEAMVDTVAARRQAPLDAFAAAVEATIHVVPAMFKPCGTPLVAQGGLVQGASIQSRFGPIATTVQALFDALAATVHAVFDAVATTVQPVLDAVALVGSQCHACRQQQQAAGERGGKQSFHGFSPCRTSPAWKRTSLPEPG